MLRAEQGQRKSRRKRTHTVTIHVGELGATSLAALFAGAINSVAGGGSFLTFPTLIAIGITPMIANTTNNVGQWASTVGSVVGYREELRRHRHALLMPLGVAAVGGIVGAMTLLATPERLFAHLIPWLLLIATLAFAAGPLVRRLSSGNTTRATLAPLAMLPLFIVAVYGGYFGAGVGILTLAILTMFGMNAINSANAYKSAFVCSINGAALIPFIISGKILWTYAILLAIGMFCGAYISARAMQRVPERLIRGMVIVIGLTLAAFFFRYTA